MAGWIALAAVLGAITAWSLDVAGVYNPIDKLVDLFRSAEAKAMAEIAQAKALAAKHGLKVA